MFKLKENLMNHSSSLHSVFCLQKSLLCLNGPFLFLISHIENQTFLCTCDEHRVLYGDAESLYCTPETNITLYVNKLKFNFFNWTFPRCFYNKYLARIIAIQDSMWFVFTKEKYQLLSTLLQRKITQYKYPWIQIAAGKKIRKSFVCHILARQVQT